MLPRNKKQKGKHLENFVADALVKIDKYAYRRADSGSGLRRKEDVFTTLPFFIECKNQADITIASWWKQTLSGCPANKWPVLIYKQNYQREPTVVIRFADLFSYIGNSNPTNKMEEWLYFLISLTFNDFIQIIKEYEEHKPSGALGKSS